MPGAGTFAGGRGPVNFTGKRNKKNDTRRFQDAANNRLGGAQENTGFFDSLLRKQLGLADAGASGFQDIFAKSAQATAAPLLRDFEDIIGGVQANVGKRFGGNPSSEELRVVDNASDKFSRNLTEGIARTGPQAVNAGLQRGNQLLGARGQAGSEELQFMRMLLQSILGEEDASNLLGKILGTAGGAATGFIASGGNPIGAVAGGASGFASS